MEKLIVISETSWSKTAHNLGQAPEFRDKQDDYVCIKEIAKQMIEKDACFSLQDSEFYF